MFYDRYLELCNKVKEKPYSVSKKLGLGNSNVAQWKKGSTPRPEVLSKIADYFGVTVEQLLTGDGQKEKNPVGITDEADEDLVEIAKLLKQLSPEALKRELAYLRSLSNDSNN